jgi:hypothetical protein
MRRIAAFTLVLACGSSGAGAGSPGGDVDFAAATCPAPAACGGDPTGTWDLVRACVEQPSDTSACHDSSAYGNATGSFTFGGTSYSLSLTTKLSECGRNETSSVGGGSKASVNGSTIVDAADGTTYSFCVEGDTLTLLAPNAKSPKLAAMTFARRGASDAGSDH